jgi:glutathione S-transferase
MRQSIAQFATLCQRGSRRTILDAYVLPMFRWARTILPDGLKGHPNCGGLLQRLEADPLAQKVIADEGIS